MNKIKQDNNISPELWLEFTNSVYFPIISKILEDIRDENLKLSMNIADKTIMPNESISAYVNRATGIQSVIDNIASLTLNSRRVLNEKAKKGSAVNEM